MWLLFAAMFQYMMVSNKKVALFRGDLTMPFHSIQQIILIEFHMECFRSTGFKSYQYFKIFRIHDGLVLRQCVFYPNSPRYTLQRSGWSFKKKLLSNFHKTNLAHKTTIVSDLEDANEEHVLLMQYSSNDSFQFFVKFCFRSC